MKTKIIVVLLSMLLLICGCNNKVQDIEVISKETPSDIPSELDKEPSSEEIPSQFFSEQEFIDGVIAMKNASDKSEVQAGGKTGNRDELDKLDYYYMPANVPEGYELHSITVVPDFMRSSYLKKEEAYDATEMYDFCIYNIDSGWTMKNVLKNNELIQSKYSDRLFFMNEEYPRRISYAYFETDGHASHIIFPDEIDLDNEDDVKYIESLCNLVKKTISK